MSPESAQGSEESPVTQSGVVLCKETLWPAFCPGLPSLFLGNSPVMVSMGLSLGTEQALPLYFCLLNLGKPYPYLCACHTSYALIPLSIPLYIPILMPPSEHLNWISDSYCNPLHHAVCLSQVLHGQVGRWPHTWWRNRSRWWAHLALHYTTETFRIQLGFQQLGSEHNRKGDAVCHPTAMVQACCKACQCILPITQALFI